jgi:hypothetical protein
MPVRIDSHGTAAVVGSDRLHHDVNRWHVQAMLRLGIEGNGAGIGRPVHGHVPARGSDVDDTRLDRVAMSRCAHSDRAEIVEALREGRSKARRHVLHDQDRHS